MVFFVVATTKSAYNTQDKKLTSDFEPKILLLLLYYYHYYYDIMQLLILLYIQSDWRMFITEITRKCLDNEEKKNTQKKKKMKVFFLKTIIISVIIAIP